MSKACFLIFAILLSGCTGSLVRKPFCQSTLTEFPPAFVGVYEGSGITYSERFNGAPTFMQTQVEIHRDGISLPGGAAMPIGAVDFGSMNICSVGGSIYLEETKSEGGVAILRLEVSPEGLNFAPMAFDPRELIAQRRNFIIPAPLEVKMQEDPAALAWGSSGLFSYNVVILDNERMTPDEVVKVARFSPLQVGYKRVTEKRRGPWMKLTLKEFKRMKDSSGRR